MIKSFWFGIFAYALLTTHVWAGEVIIKPYTHAYNIAGESAPTISQLIEALNKSAQFTYERCTERALRSPTNCVLGKYVDNPVKTGEASDGEEVFSVPYSNTFWNNQGGEIEVYTVESEQPIRRFLFCPPGYAGIGKISKPEMCILREEKSCPTVGNPINIGTGEKFEHEIDFSSADGILKVERFYINQNSGWTIDAENSLSVLQPGESVRANKAYSVVNSYSMPCIDSPIADCTYRANFVDDLVYINPGLQTESYLTQGRERIRFSEVDGVFKSNDLTGATMALSKISPDANGAVWKLIKKNGDNYYYLPGGQLQRIEFAHGGNLTYQYIGALLQSKTDQNGRSLTYSYDSHNRLTTVTLPDGKKITYQYGDNKDSYDFTFLKKVIWPNDESISYTYNEAGNVSTSSGSKKELTGKFDSQGNRIGTYKYNHLTAVSTEGALGTSKRTLSGYNPVSVTDGLNSTRKYTFGTTREDGTKLVTKTDQPAGSGCVASSKNITYYVDTDLKATETDFNGHKTRYAYDRPRKLETVRVEGIPAGNTGDYLPANSSLAAGMRKITTEWHAQYNLPIKTTEPRLITTFVYNGETDPFNGNAIAQCAPSSLRLLCHKIQQATTDINGAVGASAALDTTVAKREWLYTYNDRGQQLTISRGLNAAAEETREYYEFTSATSFKGDLKKITNALGQQTHFTEYDKNGRVLRMLDSNGVETQYSYDMRGRLASQSIAGAAATTHTYDLNGNRVQSVLPNGVILTYGYDIAKRLTSIENALGDKINYEYDVENNLRFERVTNASGAIGYIKEHIYDALSREQNTLNSLGQSQTHLYDANGNPTGKIDAKQQVTAQSYDALNQLKIDSDALNGKTEYSYDGQGRITQVKDPKGNATSYTYNAFGDLISQTSPDTGTTSFSYDALGNRTGATDARGIVVSYTYDALNRLKSVTYPAASGENVTYGYDDITSGVWGANYGVGRLTSISNSLAITTYKYNELGLIKMKRAAVNGTTFVTSYSYDLAGNLTSMTYPSGRIVNYTYDIAGRVYAVKTKLDASAAEQAVVSGISYLPFGPASNYTFGNGLSHAANYDNDYRLTNIQVGGILNRSYGYDPVDNISRISDLVAASKNQSFSYDALNRLSSATGIYGVLGYTYDAVGNRLSETTARGTTHLNDTYIYSPTSNRLTSISQTNNGAAGVARSFNYDDAGNRVLGTTADGQTQTYTYNKANRLETAKVAGAAVGTYIYNALGQRVSKTLAGGNKELYQYNESGQLIAVTDAAGKNLREYIYNGDQLVGFVKVAVTSNGSSSASSTTSSFSSSKSSSSISSIRSSSVASSSAASIAAITLDEATASFVGSHGVGSGFAGFTGSGFIDYTGEGQVNWPLNVTASANYTINVRYALSGTTLDRPLTLLVDGVQKGIFSFPFTASWSTWANTATITVALTAGSHTLSLKTNGQSGPNVDKVVITPIATSGAATAGVSAVVANASASSIAPIMRDEATAVLVGTHSISSGFAGFTGSGFIDYNGEGQVNWPLTIVASANYTINMRYALAGTPGRPLALLVDGVQKATFNVPATASWTTWTTEAQTIALTAGSHTISLKTTGQSGPNLDKIDLTAIVTASSAATSSSSRASSSAAVVSSSIASSSSIKSSVASSTASSSASAIPVATLYYVHNDHLGTPQVVTDKNQAVVFVADYQPFGKLQPGQVNSIELYSRFPGQSLDSETGLYYNYFRDYDPSIGRYIESDPIGLEGGINTYAYVNGNPMMGIDPLGLLTCNEKLMNCRFGCRRPGTSGACLVKCEEKVGALSSCVDDPKPEPEPEPEPKECPAEDPKPDPLTPKCTFEKWKVGKC